MTSAARKNRQMSGSEVEATLSAIKQRVRARHGLSPDGPDGEPDSSPSPLMEAMDRAHISPHFPILWDVPVVGRGLALTKRVARLLLRWYINPIVDQQNDFNAATVRVLYDLAAGQEQLRAEVERLNARLDALDTRRSAE